MGLGLGLEVRLEQVHFLLEGLLQMASVDGFGRRRQWMTILLQSLLQVILGVVLEGVLGYFPLGVELLRFDLLVQHPPGSFHVDSLLVSSC